MDLEKYHNWLRLNYNSKRTIEDYFQQTNHFFKLYKEFNQTTIEDYILNLLDENKSKYTINKVLSSLRSYGKHCNIEDIVYPRNKKIKRRAIKFYFTKETIKEVYKHLTLWSPNNYEELDLLLRFMFFTGARSNDVCCLKKSNINFEKNKVIFYNGKGEKDRSIPFIDKQLKIDLEKHCKHLVEDKVFSISYNQLKYFFKRIQRELHLQDEVVESRTMRISFAKYCVRKNVNLLIIKKWLGHSDIRTTEIYAEPDEQMSDDEGERLRKEK